MTPEATIATRASLLVRLKDREDQASWQEFFDTYWRLFYSVATKAGLNDAEAQDVVQETVISALLKREVRRIEAGMPRGFAEDNPA